LSEIRRALDATSTVFLAPIRSSKQDATNNLLNHKPLDSSLSWLGSYCKFCVRKVSRWFLGYHIPTML